MATGHPKGTVSEEVDGGTSRGHPLSGTTTQQHDQEGGMLREEGLPRSCLNVQSDPLDSWVQRASPATTGHETDEITFPSLAQGVSKDSINCTSSMAVYLC